MAMIDVTEGNYCDKAESVMKGLGRPDKYDSNKLRFDLTTSKIRNLLSLVNQIYNDVVFSDGENLAEGYANQVSYLRVRMVYEAGREQSVKTFLEKSGLLELLGGIGRSRKSFMLFCRYFEALVAYHRFLGGSDN